MYVYLHAITWNSYACCTFHQIHHLCTYFFSSIIFYFIYLLRKGWPDKNYTGKMLFHISYESFTFNSIFVSLFLFYSKSYIVISYTVYLHFLNQIFFVFFICQCTIFLFLGIEGKLQLWAFLSTGKWQGRKVSGRGKKTGGLSVQWSCGILRGK